MQALSVSDLHVIDEEPRIRDLELAERLGFERPVNVRKLIRRNMAELEGHGVVSTVETTSGAAGGRRGAEYWLNEGQALTTCILARTPRASEVRQQVVKVNLDWRRGRLVSAPQTARIPTIDRIAADLGQLEQRLQALEALGNRLATMDRGLIGETLGYADIWGKQRPGRRPAWFWNVDLRIAVFETYRTGTLDLVIEQLVGRFGPGAISRTALGRAWQRIDELKRRRAH